MEVDNRSLIKPGVCQRNAWFFNFLAEKLICSYVFFAYVRVSASQGY